MEKLVLLVEDDRDISELLGTLLRDNGYTVLTAHNGAEALKVLHTGEPPGLILLDLVMPIMDGLEFLSRLREVNGATSIPILLLSASTHIPVPAGMHMLRKPFPLQTLLVRMARSFRSPESFGRR